MSSNLLLPFEKGAIPAQDKRGRQGHYMVDACGQTVCDFYFMNDDNLIQHPNQEDNLEFVVKACNSYHTMVKYLRVRAVLGDEEAEAIYSSLEPDFNVEDYLQGIYLDWVNNYTTIPKMAEDYEINSTDMILLVERGKDFHEKKLRETIKE